METTLEEQSFPVEQFAWYYFFLLLFFLLCLPFYFSKNLSVLELQHNKLTALPAPLMDLMGSLRILKVHDNRISAISYHVAKLTCLKELWLQENEVSVLPDEIGQLTV